MDNELKQNIQLVWLFKMAWRDWRASRKKLLSYNCIDCFRNFCCCCHPVLWDELGPENKGGF